MAESACVMMQPFSYVSGLPNFDPAEGNRNLLGQSVSFGRFVADSASWEKWSVFSHNRYVEEAERYARPGSVAQKKAFFEDHYRKMAARKAAAETAAAAEQANAATASDEVHASLCGDVEFDYSVSAVNCDDPIGSSASALESDEPNNGFPSDLNCDDHNGIPTSALESDETNNIFPSALECDEPNGDSASALNCNDPNGEKQDEVGETEQSGTPETEKPPPKITVNEVHVPSKTKKLAIISARVLLRQNKTVKQLPLTPAKPSTPAASAKSLGQKKAAMQKPSTPAKSSMPDVHLRKQVYATPRSDKKSAVDFSGKKQTTPKRVLPSSVTPRGGIGAVSAPSITRKIGSSRVSGTSSVSRNCMTPTLASSNETTRNPVATPQPSRTPGIGSAPGSKSAGPKGQSLATGYSSVSSAPKSKAQSLSVSTPFRLKTAERAVSRREKLEEKFNANEAQKVQQQAEAKGQAELELKKFKQSLCFKARPLPKFYSECTGTPKKQTTKTPQVWPQSVKRTDLLRRAEDSLPAQTRSSSIRNIQSKQIQGKKADDPAPISRTSKFDVVAENVSTNAGGTTNLSTQ